MQVTLKDGTLKVRVLKPDAAKLNKAIDVCNAISQLSPADPDLTAAADAAVTSMQRVLVLAGPTAKPEPPADPPPDTAPPAVSTAKPAQGPVPSPAAPKGGASAPKKTA